MSSSINEIIKAIKDSQPAQINIPLKNAPPVQLKCIYKESMAPLFFLIFPPKKIPENIDRSKACNVSINHNDTSITISAVIEHIKGDRTLELVGKNTVDPSSLRNFFRVSMRVSVTASYEPGPEETRSHSWSLSGKTLDLSGSGLLAIFSNEFINHNRVQLDFKLPHNNRSVKITCKVIRQKRLRKNKWQVALCFESVKHQDRDFIISSCLQEQRKQLREKVQTFS